jgi:hypothetical protein
VAGVAPPPEEGEVGEGVLTTGEGDRPLQSSCEMLLLEYEILASSEGVVGSSAPPPEGELGREVVGVVEGEVTIEGTCRDRGQESQAVSSASRDQLGLG